MAHLSIEAGSIPATTARAAERLAAHAVFAGLAIVFLWFGGMKFTAYEAEAISGLVSNSPILAWVYDIVSIRTFGVLLGLVEVSIGLLIAARLISSAAAPASALGGALAAITFVVTTSFLLSTPGVVEPTLGFPGLSVMPGQFLLKDVALLAASVFVAARSYAEFIDAR
ncbi:MAG: DUF417 family protein [Pseudomonadota bacterium]